MQNSALQIILQADKRVHIKDMHQALKLKYLSDRRKEHTLSQVYKCVHKLGPRNINDQVKLVSDQHTLNTRSAAQLKLSVSNVRLSMQKSMQIQRAMLMESRG